MKKFLAFFLIAACTAVGQQNTTAPQKILMPSDSEVQDLLKKADEKIAAFEVAVKAAKPSLDKINPRLSADYLAAASSGRQLVFGMQKNGHSAYGLVALLSTLDDLSLNSANGAFQLLRADVEEQSTNKSAPDLSRLTAIMPLQGAQVGCSDISELLMHTTLRVIQAEEKALTMLLEEKK